MTDIDFNKGGRVLDKMPKKNDALKSILRRFYKRVSIV